MPNARALLLCGVRCAVCGYYGVMQTLPGQIGPFEIERTLSRGGMGEVYVAHDTRRSKAARDASERAASNEKASGDRRDTDQVLLKLLAPELLGDVALAERFHREGEALSRLTHPGVQRWIETGHSGRRPYVALVALSLAGVLARWLRAPPTG